MKLDPTQQRRADIETAAGRAYVVRYVVTQIDRAGNRALALAMQGRYTHDTPEAAAAELAAITANNSPAALASVFGDVSRLAVRAVVCYPGHHDPIGRYFDADAEAAPLDPDAPPVPAGCRPRAGVEFGCGNAACPDCYERDSPRGGVR